MLLIKLWGPKWDCIRKRTTGLYTSIHVYIYSYLILHIRYYILHIHIYTILYVRCYMVPSWRALTFDERENIHSNAKMSRCQQPLHVQPLHHTAFNARMQVPHVMVPLTAKPSFFCRLPTISEKDSLLLMSLQRNSPIYLPLINTLKPT